MCAEKIDFLNCIFYLRLVTQPRDIFYLYHPSAYRQQDMVILFVR